MFTLQVSHHLLNFDLKTTLSTMGYKVDEESGTRFIINDSVLIVDSINDLIDDEFGNITLSLESFDDFKSFCDDAALASGRKVAKREVLIEAYNLSRTRSSITGLVFLKRGSSVKDAIISAVQRFV